MSYTQCHRGLCVLILHSTEKKRSFQRDEATWFLILSLKHIGNLLRIKPPQKYRVGRFKIIIIWAYGWLHCSSWPLMWPVCSAPLPMTTKAVCEEAGRHLRQGQALSYFTKPRVCSPGAIHTQLSMELQFCMNVNHQLLDPRPGLLSVSWWALQLLMALEMGANANRAR